HGARLFDQLVGAADECWRDRKSKNPGSLKVDSQLELGWQLNWKFVRLCAPEYAVNVGSCAIKQIGQNDSIRYQAAVSDKEAKRIDSGQREGGGKKNNRSEQTLHGGVGQDDDPAPVFSSKHRDGSFTPGCVWDLAFHRPNHNRRCSGSERIQIVPGVGRRL